MHRISVNLSESQFQKLWGHNCLQNHCEMLYIKYRKLDKFYKRKNMQCSWKIFDAFNFFFTFFATLWISLSGPARLRTCIVSGETWKWPSTHPIQPDRGGEDLNGATCPNTVVQEETGSDDVVLNVYAVIVFLIHLSIMHD